MKLYFDQVIDVFRKRREVAEALACEIFVHRKRIGGKTVEFVGLGRDFHEKIWPTVAHLPDVSTSASTEVELRIWYGTDKGLNEKLQAPNWKGLEFKGMGTPVGWEEEGTDLQFQPWAKQLFMHRKDRKEAVWWVKRVEDLAWWEATFPFRTLLHWWCVSSTNGLQLMHAGAAGIPGEAAWLIPGPSGSGKSTTCTALARSGMCLYGDDYVLVDTELEKVYTLYDSTKLIWSGLNEHFEDLRNVVLNPEMEGVGDVKAVMRLRDLVKDGVWAGEAKLQGILIPAIQNEGGHAIGFSPISAGPAVMAIAPTTLHHLPTGRKESWNRIQRLCKALPVLRWNLPRDITEVPKQFRALSP